jgi:HEPN domain-containing protein
VVFHVQQCIKKSIKAVLCHTETPLLLIHDLGSLLGGLPEGRLPKEGYTLTRFNDYAGILRYEEGRAILTHEDTAAAIEVVRSVLDWAKGVGLSSDWPHG